MMEEVNSVVDVSDKKRLLSTDDDQDDTSAVSYNRLPAGAWLLERMGVLSRFDPVKKKKFYQMTIVILTFCCYASLHMARMAISVVKSTLHPDCNSSGLCANPSNSCAGWEPFDELKHGKTLLGALDYAWLFPYAITMFFSGQIADKTNLRYFLTVGMLGSALSVGLFGMGYFWNVHQLYYFVLVQVLGGIMQSTGWPGVVAVMANWFGKGRRGLIMGVWNSHTGVGNLMGVLIPGIWAHHHWGWSFLSAAFTMLFITVLLFTFLVIEPTQVGLPQPRHHLEKVASKSSKDRLLLDDQKKIAAETRSNSNTEEKAISFFRALLIPGIIEFAIALFFSKLVSYAFLFWLPFYIKNNRIGLHCLNTFQSGALATMFDVGAMIGGVVAGLVSDLLQARAFTSAASLILAIPSLYLFKELGDENLAVAIVLMIITGVFVNGPYAMITTAVSADLGTHKSLQNSQKAKATVTAIIDGTGSIGGAVGPFLTGLLVSKEGWDSVFYLFMLSSLIAALILSRLIFGEVKIWQGNITARLRSKHDDNIISYRMTRETGSTSDVHIEETELGD